LPAAHLGSAFGPSLAVFLQVSEEVLYQDTFLGISGTGSAGGRSSSPGIVGGGHSCTEGAVPQAGKLTSKHRSGQISSGCRVCSRPGIRGERRKAPGGRLPGGCRTGRRRRTRPAAHQRSSRLTQAALELHALALARVALIIKHLGHANGGTAADIGQSVALGTRGALGLQLSCITGITLPFHAGRETCDCQGDCPQDHDQQLVHPTPACLKRLPTQSACGNPTHSRHEKHHTRRPCACSGSGSGLGCRLRFATRGMDWMAASSAVSAAGDSSSAALRRRLFTPP
jgi:hypothetical protein